MARTVRIVHCLNQFFGQFGGEDKADLPPQLIPGPVGPGRRLQEEVAGWGEVVATLVCGDGYMADHLPQAAAAAVDCIADTGADLVLAGPAFAAGRYGLACGEVCRQVQARLGIPAVTGMDPTQPAVEIYRREVMIAATAGTALGMSEALTRMAAIGRKLATGAALDLPDQEGYIPRGVRRNTMHTQPAGERAVAMLLAKLRGEAFTTEIELPHYDRLEPAAPLTDLTRATIALITTGGIVPAGNPDRLQSFRATRYGRYAVSGLAGLPAGAFIQHHGGYFAGHVDADPNRMVPADVLLELAQAGAIGAVYPHYFTTAGTGTFPQAAVEMAAAIAGELRAGGADGAILTST